MSSQGVVTAVDVMQSLLPVMNYSLLHHSRSPISLYVQAEVADSVFGGFQ